MNDFLESFLPVLAVGGFFLTIYGCTRVVVTARNRERLAIIERNPADAAMLQPRPGRVRRVALVLLGVALGTLLGWGGTQTGMPPWVAWLAGGTLGLGLALCVEYRFAERDARADQPGAPPGVPA